jgi:hypothetical protein
LSRSINRADHDCPAVRGLLVRAVFLLALVAPMGSRDPETGKIGILYIREGPNPLPF